MLGRIAEQEGFYKLHRSPDARPVRVCRCLIQGSLLFFNTDHIGTRLGAIAEGLPAGSWLVLDASAVVEIDSSATAMLEEALSLFEARHVRSASPNCTASRWRSLRDPGCWSGSVGRWCSTIWRMPMPRSRPHRRPALPGDGPKRVRLHRDYAMLRAWPLPRLYAFVNVCRPLR